MKTRKLGGRVTAKKDPFPYYTGSRKPGDKRHIGYFDLPYGVWTSSTGREVVFNRSYMALWAREPDGPTARTPVKHFTDLFPGETYEEEWFIADDLRSPLMKDAYWRRSEQILMAFITGRSVQEYKIAGAPGEISELI